MGDSRSAPSILCYDEGVREAVDMQKTSLDEKFALFDDHWRLPGQGFRRYD
jgi:hypothetical protein